MAIALAPLRASWVTPLWSRKGVPSRSHPRGSGDDSIGVGDLSRVCVSGEPPEVRPWDTLLEETSRKDYRANRTPGREDEP